MFSSSYASNNIQNLAYSIKSFFLFFCIKNRIERKERKEKRKNENENRDDQQ